MTASHHLDALESGVPRSTKFDRKKESILAAGARIFNRDGVQGATLADVAAEVDLNIKSLRYYFTRKDDLAAAAFLKAIKLYSTLIVESSTSICAEERVRTFIRLYFALGRDVVRGKSPPFLHFGDLRSLSEPQAGPVFAAFVDMFRSLRKLVMTPELATGGRPFLNARTHLLLSQLLWSVVWTQRYEPDDLARAGERMADVLINGLAADRLSCAPNAPSPPITRPDDGKTAQSIFLRAATVLINDQGYRGASIDKIAASVNMTKGAFYHYHDAKDELVIACFERTFEIMRRAQTMSERATQGFSRLADATQLLIHHQLAEEGPLLRTSALTAVPAPIRFQMTARLDRITSRFADVISDGMIDGSIRPCDPPIASQMITAAINSAEELSRWTGNVTADEAVQLYARPAMHGLYR